MLKDNNTIHLFTIVVFLISFLLVPFAQSNYLSMMPGDIGDARLNNYFLENVYQFFSGHSESLWHFGFFNPFPYSVGFSDNLFGSSPVYSLARILTGQSDTAFQIWYLGGFLINFIAAYQAFCRLDNSRIASTFGALIFSFALPVTAHSGHAQLHYRFAAPIAIAMFIMFLDKKHWNCFVASAFWLVWQFYCTIYIGFFTLLVLIIIFAMYWAYGFRTQSESRRQTIIDFSNYWRSLSSSNQFKLSVTLFVLLSLLVLLFYPYLRVTQLYGANRSLGEIASMLPRPQSYFLSDQSWLWSSQSKAFAGIPMRHEHQMFIGAVPMLMAVIGFLLGRREKNGITFTLLSGSLACLIILTLHMGGISLWFFFAKVPLASAIRAMTRIDLIMLFLFAYLAAVAVDALRSRARWVSFIVSVVIIPTMIFEFSATSPPVSAKSEWRKRLAAKELLFPKQLRPDSIVFFAQSTGPFYADELDAMWVAINHGVPTLNGYSGFYPPGFAVQFGNDCSELPKRILSYLSFIGRQDDKEAYVSLMQRVAPIGFMGCDDKRLTVPPAHNDGS
jgi:hypothetical protein